MGRIREGRSLETATHEKIAIGPPAKFELRRLAVRLTCFLALLALLWLLFYFLWQAFPYARNGSDLVMQAKENRMIDVPLFKGEDNRPVKLLVFGDSRALCAFIPNQYDQLSGGRISSWNLGMPGEPEFLRYLQQAIRAGNVPTHAFLLVPWNTAQEFQPTPFVWFQSDQMIANRILPFRKMPRDTAVFILNARRKHESLSAFYAHSRQIVDDMIADRGYYFIAGSVRFPDGRLPDDFVIWVDDPNEVRPRDVLTTNPKTGKLFRQFAELLQIAAKHNIKFIFIPQYIRKNNRAEPPPINEATVEVLKPYPAFSVVGPDYIRYPNRYFSDEVHLNREGAEVYTRDLWGITQSLFEDQPEGKAR